MAIQDSIATDNTHISSTTQIIIMASEEERAAILAEYKASVASANPDDEDDYLEDEDEADFDPDSDEEEFEGDVDSEEEAAEEQPDDYCVLTGSIHLNEEGRIIYSGTWCMKSEFDDDIKNTLHNGSFGFLQKLHKKNYPKFKLKSQNVCYLPGGGGGGDNKKLFDIHQPTLTETGGEVSSRRIVMFDGFFCEKPPPSAADDSTPKENGEKSSSSSSSPKKIKERDVELFISLVETENTNDGVGADGKSRYRIAGRGQNEYGQFVLDGSYIPPTELFESKATVICNKRYGVGGDTKETRAASKGSKRKARADDDSFDEDFDSEERADYTELIELSEDANLSVEELRKKYYGGGDEDEEEVDEDDDGGGKIPAAKKPRLEEESDDEECGF